MIRLLIFFAACVIFAGCGTSEVKSEEPAPVSSEPEMPGMYVFVKNCKLCHGADGTLGVSGAANLAISALSVEEKIQVITNGRRGMASFKGQLTPEEIRMVAEYVQTLRR